MQALFTLKRINRTEFIAWSNISLILIIATAYLLIPFALSIAEHLFNTSIWLSYICLYIFYAAICIFPLKLLAQRYRDTGITGWAALVGLLPLSYVLLYVLMAIFPGEKSTNKYGDAPASPNYLLSMFALFSQIIIMIAIAAAILFS